VTPAHSGSLDSMALPAMYACSANTHGSESRVSHWLACAEQTGTAHPGNEPAVTEGSPEQCYQWIKSFHITFLSFLLTRLQTLFSAYLEATMRASQGKVLSSPSSG
jgi:hypothetical protein